MDPHHDPFGGDEEAALRYAIALSLQDPHRPVSHSNADDPIVLDSDGSEDDDLDCSQRGPPTPKKSVQLSEGATTKAGPTVSKTVSDSKVKTSPSKSVPQAAPSVAQSGIFAALGLDRKQMEAERLARATKRKAPDDGEPAARQVQRTKLSGKSSNMSSASSAHGPASTQTDPLSYPKGVVKKTWASGYPRDDDDIKIEEILVKDQLELAVLSSFVWDDDWLMSKIDLRRTKMICVAFASSEQQKEAMRANVPKDRIRFCFPPMGSIGCMHSKLQLLKFPNSLRIVIPTGNLVPYDWGESGNMENMVFIIDLPRTNEPSNQLTAFGQELCYFLKASGLDDGLINSLLRYDFSETQRYRFVHTIGQSHVGEAWQRTGYCGLGRAVKSLGLNTSSEIELDFVAASLGSIKTELLSAIYNAAQGDNGLKEYEKRATTSKRKKETTNPAYSYQPENFRIYFPSHETVSRSRGGKNAGGTICLQGNWWNSSSFPRELIRDCKSVRPGLLMHTKILFVRHRENDELRASRASWVYLGSANLSESAWGRLVKDKASGQPKLSCRNWECGVLIPMDGENTQSGWDAFKGKVPLPMIVPGEDYGRTNSKKPWLFLEN